MPTDIRKMKNKSKKSNYGLLSKSNMNLILYLVNACCDNSYIALNIRHSNKVNLRYRIIPRQKD